MLDEDAHAPPEILSWSPGGAARDRWAARTLSGRGERVAAVRDLAFDRLDVARHHRVLDLSGGSGWSGFEALRRAPEGETWLVAPDEEAARTIRGQTDALPDLERPVIVTGERFAPAGPVRQAAADRDARDVDPRFDRVLALRWLSELDDPEAALGEVVGLLAPGGRALFGDPIAARAPRLHAHVDLEGLPAGVAEAVRDAEEAAYRDADAARFRYDPDDAAERLKAAGFASVRLETTPVEEARRFPARALDGWFAADGAFRARLAQRGIADDALAAVEARFRAALQEREVPWRVPWAWLRTDDEG
jgi:SAM-dependent methyltransferase